VRKLLIEYVNAKSNEVDLQFDPRLYPPLPYDPCSKDPRVQRKVAHYLLLVASLDEGNIVGEAGNARKLLVGCYSILKEELFTSDEDAFREACARLDMVFSTRKSRLIPSILGSVNSFVSNQARGDLVGYSKQFDRPFELAEQISRNIFQMGRTEGSSRKKTWVYLRWMVRSPPDLRVFDHMRPSDLFVPLDKNVARVAVCLNILPVERLGSLTWDDTVKVTEFARQLFPEDPARVDYPFFLLGRKLRGSSTLFENALISAMT